MDETTQDFILLSGVITEDIENGSVNIALDDNYTLICKSYEILRDNKINEIYPLSKTSIVSLEGVGALKIKATGQIVLNENYNFIDLVNEISSRKTPFTLNIGSHSFSNIILKSFKTTIDSFGITADCNLIFEQVSEA